MKNLNSRRFSSLLTALGACSGAALWAKGKSLSEVWSTCHRGDWMLWLVARYGDIPRKTIVSVACDCVEPALAHTTDPRPAECLAVVRRWLKDEAAIEEVRVAARAARAAARAAAQAAQAADAAWAARADAAWAARAADAADAADTAAWDKSLKFSADICRKYIEVEG